MYIRAGCKEAWVTYWKPQFNRRVRLLTSFACLIYDDPSHVIALLLVLASLVNSTRGSFPKGPGFNTSLPLMNHFWETHCIDYLLCWYVWWWPLHKCCRLEETLIEILSNSCEAKGFVAGFFLRGCLYTRSFEDWQVLFASRDFRMVIVGGHALHPG